ncbi:hypothetical protein D9M73_183480 [compost metagenome]
MNKHLRPRLVQLQDDLFHTGQRLRLAQQHQRVLAGIGLDDGLAGNVDARSVCALRAIQAFAHLAQHFGKLLGIAVLQAHHPPVLRGSGCWYIQRACQLRHALPGLGRAKDQQAVTARINQHPHAAVGPSGGCFDHREHRIGPGLAQAHQLMVMPLAAVELQYQVLQAIKVGCGVGHHQGIGRTGRPDVATAGNQRP